MATSHVLLLLQAIVLVIVSFSVACLHNFAMTELNHRLCKLHSKNISALIHNVVQKIHFPRLLPEHADDGMERGTVIAHISLNCCL